MATANLPPEQGERVTRVVSHRTLQSFAHRAGPFLSEDEAQYNLMLGSITRLGNSDFLAAGPLYHATIEAGGLVVGCALRTPPFRLQLTEMPAEVIPDLLTSFHLLTIRIHGHITRHCVW